MTLNQYARESRKTAQYKQIGTFEGFIYNVLKLCGEAGEIADKAGKIYGKGDVPTPEQVLDFKKEAGDVLWHLTNACKDLGITLDDVAITNLEKLADRQQRDVIVGHGDNR